MPGSCWKVYCTVVMPISSADWLPEVRVWALLQLLRILSIQKTRSVVASPLGA